GCGSNAGFREHFRDELHAIGMVVSREIARKNFLEEGLSTLGDTAAQFSRGRVVINFPARRIGRLLIDSRFSKRKGIGVDRVAAARFDVHGMIRNRRIQIVDGEGAAIYLFGVVILEAENPFASWR